MMKRRLLSGILGLLSTSAMLAHATAATENSAPAAPPALDSCNVVFESPSTNASGAVPLGNGQMGACAWIEANGDILLYLVRPDSFSEACRLLKIGKVRIKLHPAPATTPFRQELKLRQGRLEADFGQCHIELFTEPARPVLRVTARSAQPTTLRVTNEGWRTERRVLKGDELIWIMKGAPDSLTVAESADVALTAAEAPDALAWYHRNEDSVVPFTLKHQSCDQLAGTYDPLLHRTFGAWIDGPGLKQAENNELVGATPSTTWDLRISCPNMVTDKAQAWVTAAREMAKNAPEASEARGQNEAWWASFWNRSWILVKDGESPIISWGYNRQRYVTACQGRGEFPIKFNGGMFTVEPGFAKPKVTYNADWRRWGDGFWFQNTRLMYHPMLASGDHELMAPFFAFYTRARPLAEARTQSWYGAQGCFFPENMNIFGTYSNGDYGWNRAGHKPGEVLCPWWATAWNQGPELVALMLDYWDWTGDEHFAREQLLPMAGSILRYFDTRFKKDPHGILILDPCQVVETYWNGVVNDLPCVSGLRNITARLTAMPAELTTAEERAFFARMAAACPAVPTEERTIDGKPARSLAPAEQYAKKTHNCENPELYAIWPFRLYGVGKPDLEVARNAYATRKNHLDNGWGYDGNAAAGLGLTDEAARILLGKCRNSNKAYRFPATWGPNFDWLPDQNHGGNLLETAQLMLMQCDGRRIQLLPAWPKTWDVDFKLHAPGKTTISGSVVAGKLTRLDVQPSERAKDVVVPAEFQ